MTPDIGFAHGAEQLEKYIDKGDDISLTIDDFKDKEDKINITILISDPETNEVSVQLNENQILRLSAHLRALVKSIK